MGIVVNQSIKNVLVTSLGFGLGAVNTLFLFTHFLEKEYYGLVAYLISASNLIWPLLIFGSHNTLIKFLTSYSNKKEQDSLLTFLLVIPLLISVLLGLIGTMFYSNLLNYFDDKNNIVQPYIWVIFVLAFGTTYFELFFAWSKVKLKSVFGNIMKEIFLRACTSVFLVMVSMDILSVEQFIYAIVGAYIIRLLIMMIYSLRLYPFRVTFILPRNYSMVLKYSMLIFIAGSVATLLIDLDKVMIEEYLLIENVATYGICAYIASVIIIPSRAMHQITYPLTAKLLNEKSYKALQELYKKSSLTLLVISGLIFILIICNVEQLFEIIPDDYELFIWVVLLISLSKLYDNFLGNNNSILFNSDYYRIVLVIGVIMAFLAFVLNCIFLPLLGLTGAAIATFGAVFFYNTFKLWIVFKKFNMHPFRPKTFVLMIIIPLITLGFYFWDFSFNPKLNIICKSVLISCIYTIIVYGLKISPDINNIIKNIPRRAL